MQEARDGAFCHQIARRAVARAALHLGIDAISQEALDSLGGVLVAYLERIGTALAHSVESSGRTSSHCHALDALKAVELCTSTAVQRVHVVATNSVAGVSAVGAVNGSGDAVAGGANGARRAGSAGGEAAQDMSWKGLAAFCFGPDWHVTQPKEQLETSSQQQQETERNAEDVSSDLPATGGKVGPSAVVPGVLGVSGSTQFIAGWHAPYPDELPYFPATSYQSDNSNRHPNGRSRAERIANPHPLPLSVSESLHGRNVENENEEEKDGEDKYNMELDKDDNPDKDASATALDGLLDDLPDAFFTSNVAADHCSSWGDLDGSSKQQNAPKGANSISGGSSSTQNLSKRKTPDEDGNPKMKEDEDDGPPLKKAKTVGFTAGAGAESGSGKDSSPSKKKKKDDSTTSKSTDIHYEENNEDGDKYSKGEHQHLPLNISAFLPVFCPRFPKASDAVGRTILDAVDHSDHAVAFGKHPKEVEKKESEDGKKTNKEDLSDSSSVWNDPALQVRSALVNLGHQQQHKYWGSGWEDNVSMNNKDKETDLSRVVVPAGLLGDAAVEPQIIPVVRASGSRVTRILEGSMEPNNPV